jgi:hypothetical protein
LVNHEFGYKVILWDIDPLDWKRPGPDVVAQRIIAGARPGSIILSHDIHPPTIAAMPKFLTYCSQRDSNSSPSPSCSQWTKAESENRQNDSAGLRRKKLWSLVVSISRALPTRCTNGARHRNAAI